MMLAKKLWHHGKRLPWAFRVRRGPAQTARGRGGVRPLASRAAAGRGRRDSASEVYNAHEMNVARQNRLGLTSLGRSCNSGMRDMGRSFEEGMRNFAMGPANPAAAAPGAAAE